MRRDGLLIAGIILNVIVWTFVLTPLHWYLVKAIYGSVPDLYYPELEWLAFGTPIAALVLGAGAILAYANPLPRRRS